MLGLVLALISSLPLWAQNGATVDPSSGVPLTVLRWGFMRGARQLLPSGGGGSTDDRGEYRIYNLPAGRYFVVARPISQGWSVRARVGTAGTRDATSSRETTSRE